ncbi:ECH1 isoform 17, partial [Pongo abelii]
RRLRDLLTRRESPLDLRGCVALSCCYSRCRTGRPIRGHEGPESPKFRGLTASNYPGLSISLRLTGSSAQ